MDNIKINNAKSTNIKIERFGKSIELCKILGFSETIALLELLSESPKQFKDISICMKLSHPSLSRRLNMLQELNIIKKEPFRSKSRDTHIYNLTIRGEKLMKFISSYEKEIKLPLAQQKIIEEKIKVKII